jgi:homoserine O-succinyltransferase
MTSTRVEKFALGGPGRGDHRGALHVGLVNNMPDAALRATELQFARLLKEASGALGAQPLDVRLHLFALPQIPRGEAVLARMEGFYADAHLLPAAGLDALIVTGAEPRAADLRDEPYWKGLTQIIDWAEEGVISAYFSCLAAHAAVLHRDGIARRPLARKLSGVFSSRGAADDLLLAGLPAEFQMPHSRHNDLAEEALVGAGYRILSRLAGGGVDLFTRRNGNLQIFAQGHPEYDAATLGREYLRDVTRFHQGGGTRPALPVNYFDRATEDRLAGPDGTGTDSLARQGELVAAARPASTWQGSTIRLFANWLAGIAAEKIRRSAGRPQAGRPRKRA